MARQPTPGARDRILDKAACLFYEHGINAVGLQQVIDECACGKNLLYREFASKDELVVAYLRRAWDEADAETAATIEPFAGDPAAQLVALVQAAVDRVAAPDYRGCAFSNATAEFPDAEHPVHRLSVEHKVATRALLRRLAKQAGASSPTELADQVMLIIDGVYASGSMLGRRGPAHAAVRLAEAVVREATLRS